MGPDDAQDTWFVYFSDYEEPEHDPHWDCDYTAPCGPDCPAGHASDTEEPPF